MASLTPSPKMQFIDVNGNPIVGGKLYTYSAGTTTPLATYTDSTESTPNTNPVILDSRGEASVWVKTQLYYMELRDAVGALIWSADNVGGTVTLTALAASGGSALVGFIQAGAGAVARTMQDKARESVSIKDYGGVCDGVTPDDTAMSLALAAIGNRGEIELFGTPLFLAPIVLPTSSTGIRIFSKTPITVTCNHTGIGIDISGLNENCGSNVLENLTFAGPNTHYPSVGYVPTSTAAGIKGQTAYNNTFINVSVTGFLYGIYLKTGINNKFVGNCSLVFNQYGVYIDGGATNINSFDHVKIRENRIGGVVITNTGGAPFPTNNSFVGTYIETNIPYADGYPVGGPGDGSTSFGVKLNGTYNNNFYGVYFENQEYDIWLSSSSSYNRFNNTRHAPSADYSRLGKIKLFGANITDNVFSQCTQISRNTTDIHVESDSASQLYNQFKDCTGFNFISGSILATLDITNNKPYALLYGNPKGFISRYSCGYLNNPVEGTGRGQINGIGTATATLNAEGYGEIILGNQITSATTITTISNLKVGQIFVLKNYQQTYPVTIKASTDGITGIVLNGKADAVLTKYSDSVTFFCSGLGKVVEIGRNVMAGATGTWTPDLYNSGGASQALSTATGYYHRDGNKVTLWFTVTASVNLNDANYYEIRSLPFTPTYNLVGAGTAVSATNGANANQKTVFGIDAQTTPRLRIYINPAADFQNSDSISGTATYLVV